MSESIKMMVDLKLNVVGCVLIQAANGCGESHDFVMKVPTELWATSHTPNMKKYSLTREQATEYVKRLQRSMEHLQ